MPLPDWLRRLIGRPTPGVASPELVHAINAARSLEGLSPLAGSALADRLASDWAGTMATRGKMEHGNFQARLRAAFPRSDGRENIAWGQATPESVAADWMNSPGHRAAMLGAWKVVGAGTAKGRDGRSFWCAVFAG